MMSTQVPAGEPSTGALKAGAEAVKAICDLVRPFTDPVFSELGRYIGEKIQFLRFQQSLRVAERARKLLQECGLTPRPVTPKILVAILENAGLEDDDALVETWASLLATASAIGIPAAFPAVLAQLEPDEARIAEVLFEHYLRMNQAGTPLGYMGRGLEGINLRAGVNLTNREFVFAILNLERLGLVAKAWGAGGPPEEVCNFEGYALTPFGFEFVRACRGPGEASIT
jgi:hypothetical protein